MSDERQRERARILTEAHRGSIFLKTDRLFAWLMVAQWVFGVVVAVTLSPYAWEGKARSVHLHVFAAVVVGGLISAFPIALARLRPGETLTRHVIAIAQMLWSALLIHLSGGRIETHFHVFGSLAFLAFYRDWRVLITATVVVAADHFLRGVFWPESVYGIENAQWWRFLEHAGWVVFEDIILVMACLRGVREIRDVSERQAEVETLSELERSKSVALDEAMKELEASQEALVRSEKLAAVGQLAASVGHELRNPLAAVRNAHVYISKKMADPKVADGLATDARVGQFMGVIERELGICNRIITDLLDFARERPLAKNPCPLRPLVTEALGLIPPRPNVKLVNDVPETLPVPSIDKDMFRQVVVNLSQNAVEAIPAEREGRVRVVAEGGGERPWTIRIEDDGAGIAPDVRAKLFQPLFTTKTKGTGLGLAIVAATVQRHDGKIDVSSEVGKGTTFTIELPAEKVPAGAGA